MITNAVPLPIKFNGGLSTITSPMNIENHESPNCKNVHTNLTGTLMRRNGYDDIGTAGSGTLSNGIFDYWKNPDTHYLIAYFDRYLYKMDVGSNGILDGTLDSIEAVQAAVEPVVTVIEIVAAAAVSVYFTLLPSNII